MHKKYTHARTQTSARYVYMYVQTLKHMVRVSQVKCLLKICVLVTKCVCVCLCGIMFELILYGKRYVCAMHTNTHVELLRKYAGKIRDLSFIVFEFPKERLSILAFALRCKAASINNNYHHHHHHRRHRHIVNQKE